MNFFRDGTPQPASVLPHPATPSDPTGGIDVTLPNGAGEHWWVDPIDGFIRRPRDYAYVGGSYDTPSERLGHLPSGAVVSPSLEKSPTSDDRFGNRTPSPDDVTTPKPDQPAPGATKRPMRYLSGRIAGASGPSPFETGASAVPFVAANNPLAAAPATSFDDRFGNRVPSPSIAVPPNPDQPVSRSQSGSAAQSAPHSIRVLSGRLVMPGNSDAGQGSASTPRIPNPSPAQNGWPPANARPVPDYPVPPMVYGLPDPSATSGDNMDDWFDRWIRPLMQQ